MILADTSVWLDHLRGDEPLLAAGLEQAEVITHPAVLGELTLGGLSSSVRDDMFLLPRAEVATDADVLTLIDTQRLAGTGIGWVDAHLLCSALITLDGRLLTNDRSLASVTTALGVAYP